MQLSAVSTILDWESGDDAPSVSQLYKLSKLYKRSIGVFYLPTPPSTTPPLKRFRKPGGSEVEDYGEVLDRLTRRIESQRHWAEQIQSGVDNPEAVMVFEGRLPSSPLRASQLIRERLGITLNEQLLWHDPYTAFKFWRDQIESYGVLVFQNDPLSEKIPLKYFRGLYIHGGAFPAIILNSADAMNGRIFSLMHEFVHLIIETNGVQGKQLDSEYLEAYCNEVSGLTLVPIESFQRDCAENDISTENPPSNGILQKLASRYGVSSEVILTRLVRLNLITQEYYSDKVNELQAIYEQAQAIKKAKQKESEGGPPYSIMVLQRCGRRYSRLIKKAHEQRKISLSQVSTCLGVKTDKIPKIYQEILRSIA